jgi:benzoylformate decarboxylase
VTDDPAEAHRSVAELVVLAPVAGVCAELADRLPARSGADGRHGGREPIPALAPHNPLRAGHVFAALAARLSRDAVVIEESPSSRPELLERLPARVPLGILSPAMGGLGFGIPAAIGIRMGAPGRQVVALVGDGASLYSIQALWTAVRYRVGALVVILANGGYAIMDRLMEMEGGASPWPGFPEIDHAALARAFGCPAETAATQDELEQCLDEIVPGLGDRDQPLVLVVSVAPDEAFDP